MEQSQSPFKLIRDLGAQLNNIFAPIDVHSLPRETQKIVLPIRQQIIDARLDVRDYELAQTRVEQQALVKSAKERLEALHQSILGASSHGIFGAADVAELSARIQQIMSLIT